MRRVLIGIVLLLVAAGIWSFRQVGEWLVVEDPPEPAKAIVVLSGRMPARAIEASDLYRQGFAAEVWISRPRSPVEELDRMGIAYIGEEFYSQKVLIHLGVPADAIRVLERPAADTEQELKGIADQLREVGGDRIIVVTSKPHTRRVRAIWHRLVGESPQLIVRYATGEGYDATHWWRRTDDVFDVAREVLGLVNAWAGFPVRPANHGERLR